LRFVRLETFLFFPYRHPHRRLHPDPNSPCGCSHSPVQHQSLPAFTQGCLLHGSKWAEIGALDLIPWIVSSILLRLHVILIKLTGCQCRWI
jgi:hypothetical protein